MSMYAPSLTYAETAEGQMTLTPNHPENNVSSFLRSATSCGGDYGGGGGGASRSAGHRKSPSRRRRHRLDDDDDDDEDDDGDEYDDEEGGDDYDDSSFDDTRYDRRGSRSRQSTFMADETREGAAPTADSYYAHNHHHRRGGSSSPRNPRGGEQDFDADPTELFAAIHSRNWTKAGSSLRHDPDQASIWIYRLDDDHESKKNGGNGEDDQDDDHAACVEPQRPVKWRTLPLHAAVLFRAPPKLLRSLLKANPLAACHRDDRSMLPLHLAIKTGTSKATVRALLEAYPQALDERDDQGLLPLDLAKTSTSPYRRAYLNAWAEYYYKLHRECDFDTNPTELYSYLMNREWEKKKSSSSSGGGNDKNDKDGAKVNAKAKGKGGRGLSKVLTQADAATWVSRREPRTDDHGSGELRWRMLPLHAAILFQAPDSVVTAILHAHPEAAQGADDSGMLPVHVALAKRCSETVLNALLRAYPQSMDVRDGRGNLPIDVARRSKSVHREAYVEALERNVAFYMLEEECDFDANPTSLYLSIEDGNWDVAEHLARNCPEEVRTWVAKREEIKSKKKAQKGTGEKKGTAEEGKDDDDESASLKDTKVKWRMLPLHAAILFAAPTETIRALVQSYPDGCSCKTTPEKMLPVHIAIKNELPVEVVELMLMYYPDCLIDADVKGRTVFTLAETSKNPSLRAGYMGALDRGPMYWKRLREAQEQGGYESVGDEDYDAGIGGIGTNLTSAALASHDHAEYGEADLATPIEMKARAQSNVRAARAMDENGILLPPTFTPGRAAATGASAAAALAAANYIHQQQMKGSHVQPQQQPEYYTTSPTQGSHGGDCSDEANFPGKKEQGAISQYLSRSLSNISPSKKRKDSKFIGKELVGVPQGSFDVSKIKTRAASPPPQARNGGFSSGGAAKNRSSSAKRLRQKVSKVLRSASRSKSRQRSEVERDTSIHAAPTYSEQRAMAPSNQFAAPANAYAQQQHQTRPGGNGMPLIAGVAATAAVGGAAAMVQQNMQNPNLATQQQVEAAGAGAQGGAMAPTSTRNGVIAPESINVGQPDEIQNVVSDLTDPYKPRVAPESILKPQKRGLGYSPSADANEAAAAEGPTEAPVYNGTPAAGATEDRPFVSPGAMLAKQEQKEMAAPATHRLVMKSGLKGSKGTAGGMARQRSSTPSRSNGRKDQAAIEREAAQYAATARNRNAASGTSAGVLRSGLKDKKKANKKNRNSSQEETPKPRGNGKYSSRMAAANQKGAHLNTVSTLTGNPSMVSRDTLQDVQQTMNLLNPNAGANGMATNADLLSRIGPTGYPSAYQNEPIRDLSRAQSMDSTGSSITGSTRTAREVNRLEQAVDDVVDAMGEAIFDSKLMNGIASMLGGKDKSQKKADDETITYASSFHLNEIGPQKR